MKQIDLQLILPNYFKKNLKVNTFIRELFEFI